MAYRRTTEFEERDYLSNPRRSEYDGGDARPQARTLVRDPPSFVRERETDRTPAFLREDARRSEAGQVVLRKRDIETFDRHRDRSPSPVRVREERLVRRPRSVSPPPLRREFDRDHDHEHERSRTRIVEKERIRSPSLPRPPSPTVRFVGRRRRSPSPIIGDREHIHTRIVETERERIPSPSPSPSPPPKVVRGPIIEREVITHYTDVDHGTIQARRPSPAPRPRVRESQRETDIDISLSKDRTEVDIHRSSSRRPSRSRERRVRYHDDDIVVRKDSDHLRITDDYHSSRRRARSAVPLGSPMDEEEEYITSRIDSRGKMGEAWGGATKDWTIVDVPPGTERVRMDGAGGGSTDTKWSRYSGVRRTQFIPERDGALVPMESAAPRERSGRDRLGVSIQDRDLEIDIERTKERTITRLPNPPQPPPAKDMWTEITKDLVTREALETLGYEFEETKWFYYIMDYLPYDDVLRLIEYSNEIRRSRRRHARELEVEIDYSRNWDRQRRYHQMQYPERRRSRSRRRRSGWDEERLRESEIIVDDRRPAGGYYY